MFMSVSDFNFNFIFFSYLRCVQARSLDLNLTVLSGVTQLNTVETLSDQSHPSLTPLTPTTALVVWHSYVSPMYQVTYTEIVAAVSVSVCACVSEEREKNEERERERYMGTCRASHRAAIIIPS